MATDAGGDQSAWQSRTQSVGVRCGIPLHMVDRKVLHLACEMQALLAVALEQTCGLSSWGQRLGLGIGPEG